MRYSSLAAAAACASLASGHTIFVQLEADGTTHPVSQGVRTPSYDGPISDVSSNSLACNGPPNDQPKTTDAVLDVTAGSTVTALWRHALNSGFEDVMDRSPLGPTPAYLKKVEDAAGDLGSATAGEVNIQEDGLDNGLWGMSKAVENARKHGIQIPDCLPDGQYMQCAQINIFGGKATATPQTHGIPGIYEGSSPCLFGSPLEPQ
ncbi:hypothetical protein DL771_004580 [Monosporascus sp. 5C6A]|nr:hypothetical protein DL771_004580 [Monosporascus sp. 5C6A]